MANPLVPTSLVGSYPQPAWLIDGDSLAGRFPPRIRARELWRVDRAYLEQAKRDASRLAIADQCAAGLDIITDGETGRESYSNAFATALDGVDIDNPGTALDRSGHPNPVPRVVGPIKRPPPAGLGELAASTARQISIETAQSGLDCSVLAGLAEAGKTVILGVLNLGDHAIESAEEVADRVRRALPYVPADQLVLAPDCGMKYLPRESARGKLTGMTAAAAMLRDEITLTPAPSPPRPTAHPLDRHAQH